MRTFPKHTQDGHDRLKQDVGCPNGKTLDCRRLQELRCVEARHCERVRRRKAAERQCHVDCCKDHNQTHESRMRRHAGAYLRTAAAAKRRTRAPPALDTGSHGQNTTTGPPIYAGIKQDIPQNDYDTRNQFKAARHAARVHKGPDVMLNEAAFVARSAGRRSQSILEWRQRTRPTGEIHDRGPDHDRYVNPSPIRVEQHSEGAENRNQDKGEVEQEHQVRGEPVDHDAMSDARLTDGPKRLR
jgi:hypothetical protein